MTERARAVQTPRWNTAWSQCTEVRQHEDRIGRDRVVDAREIRDPAFLEVARDRRVVDVSYAVQVEELNVPVDAARVIVKDRYLRL